MPNFRNLSLEQLLNELEALEAKKRDIVVPAKLLRMQDTNMIFKDSSFGGLDLSSAGIDSTLAEQIARPNGNAHRQIADKLNIPWKYYDRMRTQRGDILDANVSMWLAENDKNYLMRMYEHELDADGGSQAVPTPFEHRAFLSNSYRGIDNLLIMKTVLESLMEAKVDVAVETADITDTNLYCRFYCPNIHQDVQDFLKNYRLPEYNQAGGGHYIHDFQQGDGDGGMFSGFVLRNSETGHGKFSISPRTVVAACWNGMIREKEAYEKVHLGAKLDEGLVDWSAATQTINTDLIRSQIVDYTRHIASHDYLKKCVEEYVQLGSEKIENKVDTVINVTEKLELNEDAKKNVLDYFTQGGMPNRFGVVQAVTYHAHQQNDPDLRYKLEGSANDLLYNMDKYDYPRKKKSAVLN